MKVAIIVLNWNGREYIQACLDSLQKLRTPKHTVEVIVVDNASTDGSPDVIHTKYPKFTFLTNGTNLGYAAGNNTGLRYAIKRHFDYAWVVNPDVAVSPSALTQLLGAAGSKVGILGSKSYFAPGFEFHADRYAQSDLGKVLWFAGGKFDWAHVQAVHIGVNQVDTGQYDQLQPTEFVTGASMLLSIPMLQAIGIFDPKYYLYYEEADLCVRAARHNWQLLFVPASQVWHQNAQAAGIGSSLQDYFITRNRLLFGYTYAPWRTKIALIRQSLGQLFSGRPWQKRGVADYYLGKFGRGSYA